MVHCAVHCWKFSFDTWARWIEKQNWTKMYKYSVSLILQLINIFSWMRFHDSYFVGSQHLSTLNFSFSSLDLREEKVRFAKFSSENNAHFVESNYTYSFFTRVRYHSIELFSFEVFNWLCSFKFYKGTGIAIKPQIWSNVEIVQLKNFHTENQIHLHDSYEMTNSITTIINNLIVSILSWLYIA